MGVTWAEMPDSEGSIDRDWMPTFTLYYKGESDAKIGPNAALQSIGINPGDQYIEGGAPIQNLFVDSVNVKRVNEDGLTWMGTVVISAYDVSLHQKNPLDNRIELNPGWAQFEEAVDRDINGNPILNTAGVPYNPPVMRDVSRPILTLIRNEQSFDPSVAETFKDKTNEDVFYGYAPKLVKMHDIVGTELFHPACARYVRVNYETHFKPIRGGQAYGWTRDILSAGYQQIVGGKLVPILSKGVPVTEAVPLDASGAQLAVGGTPYYQQFDVYEGATFGDLNLNPDDL
jgi:hypothetical protein